MSRSSTASAAPWACRARSGCRPWHGPAPASVRRAVPAGSPGSGWCRRGRLRPRSGGCPAGLGAGGNVVPAQPAEPGPGHDDGQGHHQPGQDAEADAFVGADDAEVAQPLGPAEEEGNPEHAQRGHVVVGDGFHDEQPDGVRLGEDHPGPADGVQPTRIRPADEGGSRPQARPSGVILHAAPGWEGGIPAGAAVRVVEGAVAYAARGIAGLQPNDRPCKQEVRPGDTVPSHDHTCHDARWDTDAPIADHLAAGCCTASRNVRHDRRPSAGTDPCCAGTERRAGFSG